MTIPFKTTIDFYNDESVFKLQNTAATTATPDDQLFTDLWKAQLSESISDYNDGKYTSLDRITFIRGLIFATINQYRIMHKLQPFYFAGVPSAVAQWNSDQRINQTGESLITKMSARPHKSANLGGISGETVETNLFLKQKLGLTDMIGHVTEYTPQDELLPDYTNSLDNWSATELDDPLTWIDYAADVVATIAGSWSGKSFLMQESNDTIFFGINIAFDDDGQALVFALTASNVPTTL